MPNSDWGQQGQEDAKDRTLAHFGFQFDAALHAFDQAFGDAQPQTGAPVAAGEGTIDLAKRFEDDLLHSRLDADAAVSDQELDASAVQPANFDTDEASVGELDGVAHEIGEDLLQPLRIAPHDRRAAVLPVTVQLQTLVGGQRFHAADGAGDHFTQVECLVLQAQAAGFDAAEVQDLLDDFQQFLAGLVGHAGIAKLLSSGGCAATVRSCP